MTVPTPAGLAGEMAGRPSIQVDLEPVELLPIVGMLQLALRHPDVPATSAEVTIRLINRLVDAHAATGPAEQLRAAVALGWPEKQPLDDLVDPAHPDRLGCRCPDPLREVHAACPWHGHSSDRPLIPARVTDAICADLDRPSPLARLMGAEVVVDESVPPGVVEVRGESTVRIRVADVEEPAGDVHHGVVRPVGLVWSGIRVDELPRMYEVLDATNVACPVPLYSGEIYGQPSTGRIFVWSLAEFGRLVSLSRLLHEHRRGRGRIDPAEVGRLEQVLHLVAVDAEAIAIVRALEAAS